MDQTQALENLTDVFRTVFDQADLVLHNGMTAADVDMAPAAEMPDEDDVADMADMADMAIMPLIARLV